jgi:predicted CoA-binding protein
MDDLRALRRLRAASGDADNPSPEVLRDLMRGARRVAVIGLSRDPTKAARRVPSYLAAKGYDVVPVNPNAERIMGKRAYPALAEVEGSVDLVVIFRPTEEVGRFVRDAALRPERPAIWLQQGIFAPEETAEARAAGLVVVQDMCTYQVHRALQTAGR